jgi:N-acetyl-anhydromuramyl-L-alanine amidase AmpD
MKMVKGWLDEAIEINCMHKSMSRAGYKPTHIVLHGTAGGSSAENIGNYFRTSDVLSSTHFVVGKDAHIVQCISCDVAAFGNGVLNNPRLPFPANVNPNLYTISIEHVKQATDNSDEITSAQLDAAVRLTKILCETYGIPARRGDAHSGIITHADFDSVNRERCPGPYPWDAYWAALKPKQEEIMELTMAHPFAKAYYRDLGNGVWQRIDKPEIKVFGEIGKFYRACFHPLAGGILRLAVTGEIYDWQEEFGIVIQIFETGAIIVFDPKGKIPRPIGTSGPCLLLHRSDQIWQDKTIAPLQAIISRLEKEKGVLEAQVKLLEMAGSAQAVADFKQIAALANKYK